MTLGHPSSRIAPMARRTSPSHWLHVLALCGSLTPSALPGPIGADEPAAPSAVEATAPPTTPAVSETQRSKRLREIDRQLALDKKRITELLSRPATPETPPLRLDPELGEIAERMPRLQAERRRWIADPQGAAESPPTTERP